MRWSAPRSKLHTNELSIESTAGGGSPSPLLGHAKPLFNDLVAAANASMNTTSTNVVEAVTFTNGPPAPISMITDFYAQQPPEARADSLQSSVEGAVAAFDTTAAPYDFAYSGGDAYTHSSGLVRSLATMVMLCQMRLPTG